MTNIPLPGPQNQQGLPATQCPQCKKTMRPHCAKWRCGWAYCGTCQVTLNMKTRFSFGVFKGNLDT